MADRSIKSLEIYSKLYIGDYFAATLHFSAAEHAAFRLLLLNMWLNETTGGVNLAAIAGVPCRKWRAMAAVLSPLLAVARSNIEKWKADLRAYDGIRLPAFEWHIVRTIVLERDGYTCQYCGSSQRLHIDHIIPIVRGGSNAFENLITSCRPCNQSKGSKLPCDWEIARGNVAFTQNE